MKRIAVGKRLYLQVLGFTFRLPHVVNEFVQLTTNDDAVYRAAGAHYLLVNSTYFAGLPDVRRKRNALVVSLEWLCLHQGSPLPSKDALHTSLLCNLSYASCALAYDFPELVTRRGSKHRFM